MMSSCSKLELLAAVDQLVACNMQQQLRCCCSFARQNWRRGTVSPAASAHNALCADFCITVVAVIPSAGAHRREASDLVPQPLGLDNGNLLTYPLVCVKVQSESAVVFLDNDSRSLLHGLGTHTTLETVKARQNSSQALATGPCSAQQKHTGI